MLDCHFGNTDSDAYFTGPFLSSTFCSTLPKLPLLSIVGSMLRAKSNTCWLHSRSHCSLNRIWLGASIGETQYCILHGSPERGPTIWIPVKRFHVSIYGVLQCRKGRYQSDLAPPLALLKNEHMSWEKQSCELQINRYLWLSLVA